MQSGASTAAQALLSCLSLQQQVDALASISAQLTNHLNINHETVKIAELIADLLEVQKISADAHNFIRDFEHIEQRLLRYILAAINNADSTDEILHIVVQICNKNKRVSENLFRALLQCVRDEVRVVAQLTGGFVVARGKEALNNIRDEVLECTEPQIALDVSRCLTYLKVCFWCRARYASQDLHLFLRPLSIIIAATSHPLSSQARDCLISCLTYLGPASLEDADGDSEFSLVWTRISNMAKLKQHPHHVNAALSVWLCLLSSRNRYFPSTSLLNRAIYWDLLCETLAQGSHEQQKFCLSILKLSLARKETSSKDIEKFSGQALAQMPLTWFVKYSALFETIVLGRYLNQVQDCLPGLTALSEIEVTLGAPWIIALLTAALRPGMQESVRKVVGQWIVQHGEDALRLASQNASEFMKNVYLPWATMSQHFTTLQAIPSGGCACKFGEDLCSFLENILCRKEDEWEFRELFGAVVAFVDEKQEHIYPFARAFVLAGLVAGIRIRRVTLQDDTLYAIVRIGLLSGFPVIVADYMLLQCGEMASYVDETSQIYSTLQRLQQRAEILKSAAGLDDSNLSDKAIDLNNVRDVDTMSVEKTSADITDISSLERPSVQMFCERLQSSTSRCLRDDGLRTGCIYVLHALNLVNSENVAAEPLVTALSALWDEIEVQDYPREALMVMPTILLHSNCSFLWKEGVTQPQEAISKIMNDIRQLARNRIYIFTSLARSLRQSYLRHAELHNPSLVDTVFDFAMQPPVVKTEFELEAIIANKLQIMLPHRSYQYYYGRKAGYGFACILDVLNRISTQQYNTELEKLLDSLLDPWYNQNPSPPVFSPWKKTLQLQMMLIISDRWFTRLETSEEYEALITTYLQKFHHVLAIEPLPRYRFLLEWIVARIYKHFPERCPEILQILRAMDSSSPKHTVSMLRIALMLAGLRNASETNGVELMTQMVVLAASSKIAIRHEAQWLFTPLWELAQARQWQGILSNPAFARLNESIRDSSSYKNPPPERTVKGFDVENDHTLTNLVEGAYLRLHPPEIPTMNRDDFLAVHEDDISTGYKTVRIESDSIPLGDPIAARSVATVISTPNTAIKETTSFQTKTSPWDRAESLLNPTAHPHPYPVILVASLITNPHNLGGLSRIGEILGINSLQIPHANIRDNKDFTAVAVSSENWLSIEQLRPAEISQFLLQRKLEGYTVVGIEQTDSSRILGVPGTTFPAKTVLVLGSEREGIPASILRDMDWCVEIKQRGFTRSMNVQTAAAVVLYEYVNQQE